MNETHRWQLIIFATDLDAAPHELITFNVAGYVVRFGLLLASLPRNLRVI